MPCFMCSADPKAVAAFRAGLAEGSKIANSDAAKVRSAVGKFLKMLPAAAANIEPGIMTRLSRRSRSGGGSMS